MKTKMRLIGAMTFLGVCILSAPAEAADVQSAKVTSVGQTGILTNTFGDYVDLIITFDKNFSTGNCSNGNNSAIYRVYMGNASRDVALRALDGMRQIAVSAKLSGALVTAFDIGTCHFNSHHLLSLMLQ